LKRAIMMNEYGWFVPENVLAELTSPAIVLPEQLQGHGGKQGEKQLMLAVLAQAVGTFERHAHATSSRGQRLFREVEEWIESRDASWIYSFESICHALGLDADNLRAALRGWKPSRANHGAKLYRFRRASARRGSVVAPRATTTNVA
jgi:hypothetical protein